ncbi:MAG: MFS transporter [Opitutaceae bacterium]|nr:MFS transporter [Cephaloticoccus sp.]MCP5529281.1 MFS transporter [Opitutaceae bacterium]
MTASSHRLPLREMLAFGCGDFASVLYWQTFMKYLPYFYTDIFGLTAATLATMLAVSRIWDGVNDPVIGLLADRTESRWGKFRPYILFGCVPFALVGVLTFTTPGFGPAGRLLWAYVTYNALMMLYTLINIPYTAMLGVMTDDATERTRLSSIKFLFAFSAGIVVSATLLPLVRWFGGDSPQRGWTLVFVLYGLLAVIFFLITFRGTRERIRPGADEQISIRRDLRLLLANRPWLLLLATTLTFILSVAVRSSVSTHYFKYYIYDGRPDQTLAFLGFSFTLDGLVSLFNTAGQVCSVAGVFLVGLVANRFARKPLFIALSTVSILTTAAFVLLPPDRLGLIFSLELLGALASGPLAVLLWAMYADTADYGAWRYGRRTTALVFSASMMGQKFGWAIAAFFAFKLLASVGFEANVVPSAEVRRSLVLLMSLIPAALGLVSIILCALYPLNEQRMLRISRHLAKRRAAHA